ncbi:hypothetical protein PYTT13_11900 [Paracoccus yeei]|uniref:Uncharacterized protein n=1 Tax=Paracoccus yeei TaxID=147645 RepID=A0A2D2C1R1_9RHOB|nr:hypothetical protein PYTT13_11900 [Paracoccus yeei]
MMTFALDPNASHIPFDLLVLRLQSLLAKAGASETAAAILARNCAGCERDGTFSHGVFRIPGYLSTLRSGWVDGHARPQISRVGASYLRIDAMNGFAQPALEAVRKDIRAMIGESGAAIVALRNSHHFSALWPDVEPWADAGLVALTMVYGDAHRAFAHRPRRAGLFDHHVRRSGPHPGPGQDRGAAPGRRARRDGGAAGAVPGRHQPRRRHHLQRPL